MLRMSQEQLRGLKWTELSENLQQDVEFITAVAKVNLGILSQVSMKLRASPDLMLPLIRHCAYVYWLASPDAQKNETFISTAIAKDRSILADANQGECMGMSYRRYF